MFILSEVAGVQGPQPHSASLASSHWLFGSPRDKTVMKPNGNNTSLQRKPVGQTAGLLLASPPPPATTLSHNINLFLHPSPAGSVCLVTVDEGK